MNTGISVLFIPGQSTSGDSPSDQTSGLSCLYINMGNKQEKPAAPTINRPVKREPDSGDEEDEPDAENVKESEVFIDLNIFHELPHGSTLEYKVTVNPTKQVIKIKEDLSIIVNIPKESIQIYRHQRPQTEMPNDRTLHELMVPGDQQLRVRDRRLVYANPIVAP
ncbi:hypothetical protein BsWGS_17348 [Bradybaena similaris]